jgi:tetratricopeptide (TPR) repeat protein
MNGADREASDHAFSEGQGFDEPHEGFDLDPEFDVDPDQVDPVDARVVGDLLDGRSIADDAVDADALIDVGVEYVRINRHEQATETFERAARFADDPAVEQEAWVNKGVAHAELEEWDAAIGAHREALDCDTGAAVAEAETNLAYALWEFGRDEEALERAEAAVERGERLPQAWYNRGHILLERGLAEDALRSFENAIRLGMRDPVVHEEKARAHEALGEDEAAEAAAEQAADIRAAAQEELVE